MLATWYALVHWLWFAGVAWLMPMDVSPTLIIAPFIVVLLLIVVVVIIVVVIVANVRAKRSQDKRSE